MRFGSCQTRWWMIKRVSASGICLSTLGVEATASRSADEEAIYLVLAGGDGLRGRLQERGYEVLHELSGGSIYFISGPRETAEELHSIPIVNDAVPNYSEVADDIQEKQGKNTATSDPRRDGGRRALRDCAAA